MAIGQIDPSDTAGGSAHRTDLALVKSSCFTFTREQHDVTVSVGDSSAYENVIFI